MKIRILFLTAVSVVMACACTPEYIIKPQDGSFKLDPAHTSLLELCDEIQEKWEDEQTTTRVFVVAHRANTYESYRQGIPDNSIPNIEQAISAGADMVELDVRTTKDGQLVLMHNATINETTSGSGSVSDLTLAEIKSYPMKKNGKVYRDNKNQMTYVPTLVEALQVTKDRIYVNLDITGKNNSATKILAAIYEAGVEDQVILYAGSECAEYQKLNPLVAVHPYISSPEATASYKDMLGAKLFQYSNTTYINNSIPYFGFKVHLRGYLSYSNLLEEYDTAIRDKGDYQYLDKFIASGSDFVQTDLAELVIAYLEEKNLR